jgi:cell division protein FtsN
VVDDPMFDALPGGVPIAESRTAWNRRRDPMSARLAARRPQPAGMSAGQKLLLVVAFAGVAAVAFGAGLLIGASGGKLPWASTSVPAGAPGAEPVDEKLAESAPSDSAEGIITFSDRGDVPPKVEDEEAPPEPADTEAKAEGARAAARPAPAAEAGAGKEPAAAKKTARAEEADSGKKAEMTFYDTATGKREVPGLDAEGTRSGDSEAPDEAAADGPPETENPPARAENPSAPDEEAPLGADVLARRRAAESDEPPVSAPAEPEGAPSGADLLARRRAEQANVPEGEPVQPAEAPAPVPGTYTVQVATLTSRAEAQALAERLSSKGFDVRLDSLSGASGATLYRVRVGRYQDERSAERDLDRIREEPGTSPFVKAE